MANLTSVLNILMVAVGLGFVIFLHELGHFLLAKWYGVKVEKFSIGFGPTLLGFHKGETEYVLAAVPLGGFVKMLGEGPDEEASKSTDPRAYPNKSVGARMAIISAGVIMNLILGLACFVYAYGQGMEEIPTKIGAVMAGSPAYVAGMRPGDEIVSIDGRGDLTFNNMTLKIRLSGQGQVLHFELKRPGRDALIPIDIEPRREGTAEHPGIGISPSRDLIMYGPPGSHPFVAPAGLARPVPEPDGGFQRRDRVVAVGRVGQEPSLVEDFQEYERIVARHRDKDLNVVVERLPKAGASRAANSAPERATVVLPPNHFVDFGFRLKIEPIAAVQKDSLAEQAGFRKGDLIVKVGGVDFDPMSLPSVCYDHAGRPMTFRVERRDVDGATKTIELTATPDDTPPWTELAFPSEPVEVSGLGLAYPVRPAITAVAAGSPAARAGLEIGDVINAMTIPPMPAAKGEPVEKPDEFTFDDKSADWPRAFQILQLGPRRAVELTVNKSNKKVLITPEPNLEWFHVMRGEQFQPLFRKLPPLDAKAALRRGFDDTVENILNIYAMFRSLAQSRVSPKNLGGPILIAQVAYSAAGSSLTDLVHFLGILSINLAVLNFLPIPPLDGGQMLFLLAEKVRGKPLPDSALIAGTYVGLVLVLGLMVFVIFQDVARLMIGHS